MKKTIMTTLATVFVPFMAMAQPAFPPGAEALDCDIDRFTPIMSTLVPGKILYWNNPTCPVVEGPSDLEVAEKAEDDKE